MRHRLPFHYGWVIVFTGMLVLFSCLGLARFSFGMLLPSMSESLQLSYSDRGYLSAGYLIGYLLMVGFVSRVMSRIGARLAVRYPTPMGQVGPGRERIRIVSGVPNFINFNTLDRK